MRTIFPCSKPPYDLLAVEATHFDCHLSYDGVRFCKVRGTIGREHNKKPRERARDWFFNQSRGVTYARALESGHPRSDYIRPHLEYILNVVADKRSNPSDNHQKLCLNFFCI